MWPGFPGRACAREISRSNAMPRFLPALALVLSPPLAARAEGTLKQEREALTARMPTTVGIAVIIDGREAVTVNNELRFPLMSVFKFHRALAVADRLAAQNIPEGRLIALNDAVFVLLPDGRHHTIAVAIRDSRAGDAGTGDMPAGISACAYRHLAGGRPACREPACHGSASPEAPGQPTGASPTREAPAIPENCFFCSMNYIIGGGLPRPAGRRRGFARGTLRNQAVPPMSKLFIVHDFSPGSTALFAAFSQHAPLLAENGVELAPFNPWLCEEVPTHASLWYTRPGHMPPPPALRSMWSAIGQKLDAGKDVLLFTRRLEVESHRYFWTHLPEWVDLEKHGSEVLFIFGRPSLLLEQYFHLNPEAKISPFLPTYMEWIHDIPEIVAVVRALSGKSRIRYGVDPSESAVSALKPHILQQAFAFLGCPAPEADLTNPRGRGFRAHQSRKLHEALEVRFNAWPTLDERHCKQLLLELDEAFPEEWLTPLDLRQEFARAGACAASALEGLAGVAPGTLAPPPAFVTEPETDPAAPLSPGLVTAFVGGLTAAERGALGARLRNDAALLTPGQQALMTELSASDAFSHLGDAVPPPELTVLTMTYNHENFIAQCMEGVLAQKTDFPVRHLVLDHCSTDGTAAIVAEYAGRYPSIRPVLLSRHIPHENVAGLFQRCRSKYAALCDGDDYFTEPTKLQKQVDMLEANPGLGLCFHPVAAVFDDGRPPVIFPPLTNLPKRSRQEYYLADLMRCNFIQTNSVVYRWRFRDELPAWFRPDLCPGDYYWHMLHAETGKIGFIPEIMSVYRRHANALYAKTFTSSKELRRDHGMAELEAYHAYNEHFGNRYFRSLAHLANGVFSDFLQIAVAENDDRLFNAAAEKYPEFARAFLKELKQQKHASGSGARPTPGPA